MRDSQVMLSVIMPVYNGEKYLEESVWSVLNQPEKDLVLIVVNDGSTDNTQELIEKLLKKDHRVIVIQQEQSGVSVARNKGIVKSLEIGAKYIAFLDADDVWCKGIYCKKTLDILKLEEFDLIGFDYYNGTEDLLRGNRVASLVTLLKDCWPVSNHFCSFFYSTKILIEFKFFFPEHVKLYEDGAFLTLFAFYSKRYKNFHECAFIYRNNPYSVTHKKENSLNTYFVSFLSAWDWLAEMLDKDNQNIESIKSIKRTYLIEFIQQACMYGKKLNWIKNMINGYSNGMKLLNDNSVFISEKNSRTLVFFLRYPVIFKTKNRLKGIWFEIRQLFKRFKVFNCIYYKATIKDIHF